MVSARNVHVIGSFYMAIHGGFKPRPDAVIHFIKAHGFKHDKLFFLGNRLVDVELARAVKKKLKCETFTCLIIRSSKLSRIKCDAVVNNLRSALKLINEFKPDLVLSDFDNTLVFSGYSEVELLIEKLRFWEKHGGSFIVRLIYGLLSQLSVPFIKRKPFTSKDDSTEGFIRALRKPLIIHTMSPEPAVKLFVNKILK